MENAIPFYWMNSQWTCILNVMNWSCNVNKWRYTYSSTQTYTHSMAAIQLNSNEHSRNPLDFRLQAIHSKHSTQYETLFKRTSEQSKHHHQKRIKTINWKQCAQCFARSMVAAMLAGQLTDMKKAQHVATSRPIKCNLDSNLVCWISELDLCSPFVSSVLLLLIGERCVYA